MIDFEVVYKDWISLRAVISKVYAVDQRNFLIADKDGSFKWVLMEDCVLKERYNR